MIRLVPAAIALLLTTATPIAAPGEFSPRWETLAGCRLVENDWNDGDSFHVRHAGKEYIFRLYFVDTPEVHDFTPRKARTTAQARYWRIKKAALYQLAGVAAAFSAERLRAAPFNVRTRWEDAEGQSRLPRSFAVIEIAGGDLAELLVANGLARIHGHHLAHPSGTSADRYEARLKQLEAKARQDGLGAWNAVPLKAPSRTGRPPAPGKPKAPKPSAPDLPAF